MDTCETCKAGEATTASAFIRAIAKRFQEKHEPPLSDADAALMAVACLECAEENAAPFNTETAEWDWSIDLAASLADGEIEEWETVP